MRPERVPLVLLVALALLCACGGEDRRGATPVQPPDAAALLAFARCLTESGWVMYGSITCSACRAQRKAFGDALHVIEEVECNPYQPGAQTDRCLARALRTTPTWIREVGGEELDRIEGYQLLDDLASTTACPL